MYLCLKNKNTDISSLLQEHNYNCGYGNDNAVATESDITLLLIASAM